jgi:hypothetical protein
MEGSPNFVAQQPYPPIIPRVRHRRSWLGLSAVLMSAGALICAVVAVVIATVGRNSSASSAPALTTAPSSYTSSFVFNKDADKRWCESLRPLLEEARTMSTAGVIDNGPTGDEFRRYSAWVIGWADRIISAMDTANKHGSAGSWLDRSGHRLVDFSVGVNVIKPDKWWTSDTRPVFNEAAEVGTTISSYCAQL